MAVELGDGTPWLALASHGEHARRCPVCGFAANRAYSNVTTRPGDLPVTGRHTELTRHKRAVHRAEPCERRSPTGYLKCPQDRA